MLLWIQVPEPLLAMPHFWLSILAVYLATFGESAVIATASQGGARKHVYNSHRYD